MTATGSHAYQRVVKTSYYYARDHTGTFIPDWLTFPARPGRVPAVDLRRRWGRARPARRLPSTLTNPLRAETMRMGLILLFCCGLRRGELLRLRLGDIEGERTVLRIRLTKFHKSRLVPLSSTVTAELRHYLEQRRHKKLPMAPEAFFMWSGPVRRPMRPRI
jgi:integrase